MATRSGRLLRSKWIGAGIVMTNPGGNTYEYTIKFAFPASNSEAAYEATIVGLPEDGFTTGERPTQKRV